MLKPSGLPPSKGGDNRTGLGLASFVSSNAAGTYGLHVRGEDDVSYLKSGGGDWEKVTAGQQRQLRDGDRIAVGGNELCARLPRGGRKRRKRARPRGCEPASAKRARTQARAAAHEAGRDREAALLAGEKAAKKAIEAARFREGLQRGVPAAEAQQLRIDAFLERVALYLRLCPARTSDTGVKSVQHRSTWRERSIFAERLLSLPQSRSLSLLLFRAGLC